MSGRLVALGDSFTEGIGDPNPRFPNGVRGWADRMARQLGRHDPTWEYANLGIRSKTLDEVIDEQVAPAIALAPTVVTLAAGGNDILAVRTDVDRLLVRFEEAVDHLAGSGAHVVVFTVFEVRTPPGLDRLRRRIALYNRGIREISERRGVTLLDHAQLREYDSPRLWSTDRIHLSRAGHKRMAAAVCDVLGVPHTLKLRDLPEWTPRRWREAWVEEYAFLRGEVLPLVERRIRGVNEGQTLEPKWPEPVRPADGLKKLARARRPSRPPARAV